MLTVKGEKGEPGPRGPPGLPYQIMTSEIDRQNLTCQHSVFVSDDGLRMMASIKTPDGLNGLCYYYRTDVHEEWGPPTCTIDLDVGEWLRAVSKNGRYILTQDKYTAYKVKETTTNSVVDIGNGSGINISPLPGEYWNGTNNAHSIGGANGHIIFTVTETNVRRPDKARVYTFAYLNGAWNQVNIMTNLHTRMIFSSDVSLDGQTLVIGCPQDDANMGKAVVFTFDHSTYTWSPKGNPIVNGLSPTDVQTRHGFSVGINGDGSMIIIGEYKEDVLNIIEVFTYTADGGWDLTHRLKYPSSFSPKAGRYVCISSHGRFAYVGNQIKDGCVYDLTDNSNIIYPVLHVLSTTGGTHQVGLVEVDDRHYYFQLTVCSETDQKIMMYESTNTMTFKLY